VPVPGIIWADVLAHLADFTGLKTFFLVFTGSKGAQLRRSNFTRAWITATEAAALTSFHFHDLRHTGDDLVGDAGASLRGLMDLMGHGTTRAALIVQHRSKDVTSGSLTRSASAHTRAEPNGRESGWWPEEELDRQWMRSESSR
jgi:integrase